MWMGGGRNPSNGIIISPPDELRRVSHDALDLLNIYASIWSLPIILSKAHYETYSEDSTWDRYRDNSWTLCT